MQDGMVKCPRCGSQLCYAQRVGDLETWLCMSCGMTSTTLMKEGTDSEKAVTARQPQLYKDLKFVDKDGYVWYPAVITVPEKGMVYLDGTTVDNAEWVGIPFRPLTKKEKRMKQYAGKNYLLEAANTKHFGRDGFVDALSAMGMLVNES